MSTVLDCVPFALNEYNQVKPGYSRVRGSWNEDGEKKLSWPPHCSLPRMNWISSEHVEKSHVIWEFRQMETLSGHFKKWSSWDCKCSGVIYLLILLQPWPKDKQTKKITKKKNKKTFNCSIYRDLTLVVGWGGKGVGMQLFSIWTLLSAAIQRH